MGGEDGNAGVLYGGMARAEGAREGKGNPVMRQDSLGSDCNP